MSGSASVRSPQVLDDLRSALSRFGSEAQAAMAAAALELRRTLEWLQERANHWQGEVQRRQQALQQAKAALARCQASGYTDGDGHYHAPDCRAYERAMLDAQLNLERAQAELRNALDWARLVKQQGAEYQREAQRLKGLIELDLVRASAQLERKREELQGYLSVTISSSGTVALSSSELSTATPTKTGTDLVAGSADVLPGSTEPPPRPITPPESREGHLGGPERGG